MALSRSIGRGAAIALLWLGIALCGAAFGGEGLDALDEPRTVPGFELQGTDGHQHRLSDYKGNFTLVDFWAVWCTPCRKEMPSLERLHGRLGQEGLRLIAVHVGPSLENAARFAQTHGLTFPIVVDGEMRLTSWGVRGLHTSFLLDPDGRIVAEAVGDRNWDSEAMITAVQELQGR